MSVDERNLEAWKDMQKRRPDAVIPPAASGLQSGDGGGTYDGMEPRVAKLEAQMEHVLDELRKLSGLPERIGRIEERLNALPDKDWVGLKMRNWVGGGVAFLTLVTVAAKFLHLG